MAKKEPQKPLWRFIDDLGTFVVDNPQISYLYFPLANEKGMMSSITPELKGDIKTNNNTFLLKPVSRPDLADSYASRNLWLYNNKTRDTWNLTTEKITTTIQAGPLYHILEKNNRRFGVKAKVISFVPSDNKKAELMLITITNTTNKELTLTLTSAIPLYNRSADNLRDHRHVTSLLNRTQQHKYGVEVKPVMRFDESGHKINNTIYYVLGIDQQRRPPLGTFPTYISFLGEGNDFNCPASVLNNSKTIKLKPYEINGRDAIGALRFKAISLRPGKSFSYIIILGIANSRKEILHTFQNLNTIDKAHKALVNTQNFWANKNNSLAFITGDKKFDNWLRWVNIQPKLRKIFGCSFLPDFDYGRGGKGWRDLWQDYMALILAEPKPLRSSLISGFSGVRIDGTNATILTNKPGEFISDRNKISRVWMDHGIWPYFTLELYINQTGDTNILFEKTPYFRDSQIIRAREIDFNYCGNQKLKTKQNTVYQGSLLEHILAQHLTAFFNVGPHNNIRLENADWNDGLDMASEFGESVAFSSFYARNFLSLSKLLEEIKQNKKTNQVTLLKELTILLDTLHKPLKYGSISEKKKLLVEYLELTKFKVSGKTTVVQMDALINDLKEKSSWLTRHIRNKEWLSIDKKHGMFNGYYDNQSRRVEGKSKDRIKMTLAGQVFPILSNIATDEQAQKIFNSAKKFLKNNELGGFRLNTDFGKPQPDLGRAFYFAYGEKENGAIFSHMCIMFAYALYKRGFVKQGYEVLNSLYSMAINTAKSKIYPNLPEYFNIEGRGMYSYLTGSASWFIFTFLTQLLGIRGRLGDLILAPRINRQFFKESSVLSAKFNFAEKKIKVNYVNPKKLDFPDYEIRCESPKINYRKINPREILISRKNLMDLPEKIIEIKILFS